MYYAKIITVQVQIAVRTLGNKLRDPDFFTAAIIF